MTTTTNDTTTASGENKPAAQPQRVISLLGAATETLFRLGLGDKLVGRSHECDYPKACLALPCISRPRLDVDASSADIDAAVRAHSAAGEPVYKLDDEIILELDPDLLIAQDHCRVCAVTPSDLAGSTCSNVPQLVLKPATLADCISNVQEIATAMGVPERGIALRATLEERMERVRTLVKNTCSSTTKPRVALLEWCEPIMGCGYWLPELVQVAGGTALHCPPPGGATPTISFDTLMASKPDVVIFALCGFGLSRAAAEIANSWSPERLEQLKQVCPDIFVVDGNYLINRSGPRVVESCEALAEAIHPELRGHFGNLGTDMLSTLDKALDMASAGETTGSAKERPVPFDEKAETVKGEQSRPIESASAAVSAQLKCLETGKIAQAFEMNSTANQGRWCNAGRFKHVLGTHPDFCRLLKEEAGVSPATEQDGMATVVVTLPAGKGVAEVKMMWTMVAETPQGQTIAVWRTEKVNPGSA